MHVVFAYTDCMHVCTLYMDMCHHVYSPYMHICTFYTPCIHACIQRTYLLYLYIHAFYTHMSYIYICTLNMHIWRHTYVCLYVCMYVAHFTTVSARFCINAYIRLNKCTYIQLLTMLCMQGATALEHKFFCRSFLDYYPKVASRDRCYVCVRLLS
jgi:hypothetical protein